MADDAAFGVSAIALQPAHQQARRTRCDDDLGVEDGVEPGQQGALQLLALGTAFLNELVPNQGRLRLGVETKRCPGARRATETVGRDWANPWRQSTQKCLCSGRRIARRHYQPARQEHRGPAGADRASADRRDTANVVCGHYLPLRMPGIPKHRSATTRAAHAGLCPASFSSAGTSWLQSLSTLRCAALCADEPT